MVEPGRYLVGDCACAVSSVIQVEEKETVSRAILDMSLFSGFMEILEIHNGFRYPVQALSNGLERNYQLQGCTCAGTDILASDIRLPELHVDYRRPQNSSRIIFQQTGAYTLDYLPETEAFGFNGAKIPEVYYLKQGKIMP